MDNYTFIERDDRSGERDDKHNAKSPFFHILESRKYLHKDRVGFMMGSPIRGGGL